MSLLLTQGNALRIPKMLREDEMKPCKNCYYSKDKKTSCHERCLDWMEWVKNINESQHKKSGANGESTADAR